MRPSSASSSTIARPWNSPTTAAVRSSAVGPRPPLVQMSIRAGIVVTGTEAVSYTHLRAPRDS